MGPGVLQGACLFLKDTGTSRDGLFCCSLLSPPCDFMLECHEMRHRNSTDSPYRSGICSMLSGHDASVLGLLLLGQLCVGRVQHCGRGRGRRGHLCVQSRSSCISAKSFCVESFILLHMLFLKQIINPTGRIESYTHVIKYSKNSS